MVYVNATVPRYSDDRSTASGFDKVENGFQTFSIFIVRVIERYFADMPPLEIGTACGCGRRCSLGVIM